MALLILLGIEHYEGEWCKPTLKILNWLVKTIEELCTNLESVYEVKTKVGS